MQLRKSVKKKNCEKKTDAKTVHLSGVQQATNAEENLESRDAKTVYLSDSNATHMYSFMSAA